MTILLKKSDILCVNSMELINKYNESGMAMGGRVDKIFDI
jgi:hypothetical protein